MAFIFGSLVVAVLMAGRMVGHRRSRGRAGRKQDLPSLADGRHPAGRDRHAKSKGEADGEQGDQSKRRSRLAQMTRKAARRTAV